MKQLVMTVVFALVFGLAALAQNPSSTDPQSGASPSASPSAQDQNPSASPSAAPSASQTAEPSSAKEKKLKGCLQSENGKFILQEKNGKTVELTGQDLSAHVGQMVKVEGSASAGAESLPAGTGQPSAAAGSSSSATEQFSVTKIDKVSDTCDMNKSK
jgi:uncharacterized protein DUF5818